jgi:hypothetical protein
LSLGSASASAVRQFGFSFFGKAKAMSHRSTPLRVGLAAAIWLAAIASAFAQQYNELPPNSVIANILGQSNPGSAVPFNQLAAQLMLQGGLVQGPPSATAGHVVVFGSTPNQIIDVGAVAGSGTVIQVTCGQGLTGGTFTTSGTCAQNGNYFGWALQNCTLAASVASNILTVALKDNAGSDPTATSPCNINYRIPAGGTGSTALVQQTAALSINTNATGATLGSSSNTAFRFWVIAFNNSGTNVLALINCSNASTIFPLNEGAVASSTGISGSATSAGVFYTPNGTTVTSQAFRILGYVEYNSTGLVTAGTYATAPNFIQTFGPGIRKPGDVLQSAFATSITSATFTGASFGVIAGGLTVAISPSSAANPIRIEGNGTSSNTVTSNNGLQLSRGSTLIGVPVNVNIANATGGYTAALTAYDLPNTTSTTTYQFQGKASAGTGSFPAGSAASGTPGATIEVREIMG